MKKTLIILALFISISAQSQLIVTGWTDYGYNYIGDSTCCESITPSTKIKDKFKFYSGYSRFGADSGYVKFQLEKHSRMHELKFGVVQYSSNMDTLGFIRVDYLLIDPNVECSEKAVLFYSTKEWRFYLFVKHVTFFFGGDIL